MLFLSIILNTGKQSIQEASKTLYELLEGISKVDSFFRVPLLRYEGFNDVSIDLGLDKEQVIGKIERTFLDFFKNDILKNEEEQNPNFDYSRDFGFSIVVQYREGKREISFTASLGSSSVNALGQLSNNGFTIEGQLANKVLRGLVDTGLVKNGVVKLSDVDFLKACRPYKYPLGWITYISNDFKLNIPNDLEGIEYEHTDKGKYLILSRQDFTTDKETYEAHKQKLLNLMEEIKRRVPEYSK